MTAERYLPTEKTDHQTGLEKVNVRTSPEGCTTNKRQAVSKPLILIGPTLGVSVFKGVLLPVIAALLGECTYKKPHDFTEYDGTALPILSAATRELRNTWTNQICIYTASEFFIVSPKKKFINFWYLTLSMNLMTLQHKQILIYRVYIGFQNPYNAHSI